MNNRRFIVVALLLSAIWYPILLALPMHGDFIREELRGSMDPALTHLKYLFVLLAVGFAVGLIFRRIIVSADGWVNLLLGCTLPYVATAMVLVVLSTYACLLDGRFDEFLVLPYWGMLYTLLWFPLIAAVGIVMQFALRSAGRHNKALQRTRN